MRRKRSIRRFDMSAKRKAPAPRPGLSIEDVQEAARRHKAWFETLPETEKVLYLQLTPLAAAYGALDPAGQPREETAREHLTRKLGPKFAERALATKAYRDILMIDDPPYEKSDVTTVVVMPERP